MSVLVALAVATFGYLPVKKRRLFLTTIRHGNEEIAVNIPINDDWTIEAKDAKTMTMAWAEKQLANKFVL